MSIPNRSQASQAKCWVIWVSSRVAWIFCSSIFLARNTQKSSEKAGKWKCLAKVFGRIFSTILKVRHMNIIKKASILVLVKRPVTSSLGAVSWQIVDEPRKLHQWVGCTGVCAGSLFSQILKPGWTFGAKSCATMAASSSPHVVVILSQFDDCGWILDGARIYISEVWIHLKHLWNWQWICCFIQTFFIFSLLFSGILVLQ